MKTWMKTTTTASLGLALGLLSAGAYAQDASQKLQDIDKGMSDAAKDHAAQKKALAQEFKDKRQALTQSADWKTLSPADRKARLKALQQDFTAREKQLNADYKAKVQTFRKEKESLRASQRTEKEKGSEERGEHGHEHGGMGHSGGGGRR